MTGEVGGRYLECEGKDITNMWNIYNHIYIYRMFLYVHILSYYVYIANICVISFLGAIKRVVFVVGPLFLPVC